MRFGIQQGSGERLPLDKLGDTEKKLGDTGNRGHGSGGGQERAAEPLNSHNQAGVNPTLPEATFTLE